jgi:hypothetical protein
LIIFHKSVPGFCTEAAEKFSHDKEKENVTIWRAFYGSDVWDNKNDITGRTSTNVNTKSTYHLTIGEDIIFRKKL